jgi:hypothetical protein
MAFRCQYIFPEFGSVRPLGSVTRFQTSLKFSNNLTKDNILQYFQGVWGIPSISMSSDIPVSVRIVPNT